jgi:DNA-binding NtrC family response regulator
MRRLATRALRIPRGGTMTASNPSKTVLIVEHDRHAGHRSEPVLVVADDKHPRRHDGPVLIVEDDKHIRDVLAETLKGMGLAVEAFATGELALARAVDQGFCLALVDLNLPGIKGIEILRRLRAIDAELPVVMMTAYHTHDTILAARASGAVDFLCKPFLPTHVREAVGRQLNN